MGLVFFIFLVNVCPSICKLVTFSSSSPDPLSKFQLNLALSILGYKGIFFSNERPHAFPRGDNKYVAKIHQQNLKSSFIEQLTHFLTILA